MDDLEVDKVFTEGREGGLGCAEVSVCSSLGEEEVNLSENFGV
jgi:hypothetical protein